MKKFGFILLSLALVMAFSVSAFAVDVKVSAYYYVGGLYLNKVSVADVTGAPNPSTAFFYQDLRMGADFIVSPSLKLVTQFDAMERIWGGSRTQDSTIQDANGPGTRAEAENIAFRQIHVDYTSPIGLFKVGYLEDYQWGTVFGDRTSGPTRGQIQYFFQKGVFTGFLGYAKEADNSYSYNNTTNLTDSDYDSYRIAGIYNFKGGEAGVLFLWNRNATEKGATMFPYLQNAYVIDPYVKAKIGPVALQAEAQYWFGDAYKWEDNWNTLVNNVSINALSLFADATADFGMFYAGGSFAYLSGQDPSKTNTVTGGVNTAGLDWSPCLILFNLDLNYWAGNMYGNDNSVLDGEMSNAWFFQGRVGVKPTPQWDVLLSVSYAMADKKPDPFQPFGQPSLYTYPGGTYGTEIDLTATYKITDNLSYMLGGGYLFTGDYFKGYDGVGFNPNHKSVDNDYILINKLTLSF